MVPHRAVAAQRRNHTPIGDIVHGVGNGVAEIDHPKEHHKGPALELHIKGQIYHHTGQRNANGQPRLVLAPFGPGPLDDVAHDGVIQRVKYPGCHHNGGNGHKLSGGQLPGKQDIHQQEIGKQLVEHIPAHRAQGEQPKVSLAISICFVHSNTLPFTCLCIIYYNFQQIATGKFMPPLYTGPKFDYNQTENHRFCSRSSGNCPGTAL